MALSQQKKPYFILFTSVKDPNTLNLDPDPEFWPNWIRIQGYFIILKEIFFFIPKQFCLTNLF